MSGNTEWLPRPRASAEAPPGDIPRAVLEALARSWRQRADETALSPAPWVSAMLDCAGELEEVLDGRRSL